MRILVIAISIIFLSFCAFGQREDTVLIQKKDLDLKYLKLGTSKYVVFSKKDHSSPATGIMLVNIDVERTEINGRRAFAVTQKWETGDAVSHTSSTLHDASDFSTLRHEIWWKRSGLTTRFDFLTRKVVFEGTVTDAAKAKIEADFTKSFDSYNLCWHSDLTIFPLFPYKSGRKIKVNFFDPGSSSARIVEYVVTGSESLTSGDKKVDCWIIENKTEFPKGGTATQRFWISKRTHEVLKEEDEFPSGLRYKLKIGVSG